MARCCRTLVLYRSTVAVQVPSRFASQPIACMVVPLLVLALPEFMIDTECSTFVPNWFAESTVGSRFCRLVITLAGMSVTLEACRSKRLLPNLACCWTLFRGQWYDDRFEISLGCIHRLLGMMIWFSILNCCWLPGWLGCAAADIATQVISVVYADTLLDD